jgi:hypothetical protein
VSLWSSIFLDLTGAKDPDEIPEELQLSSALFDEEEIVDIAADTMSLDQVYVSTNPIDTSLSGKIYRVHKNFNKKKYDTEPILQANTNKVIVDKDSEKWASTTNSIYRI